MKTTIIQFFCLLLVLNTISCNKDEHYKLKDKTKEYIAFFGKNSWWEYENLDSAKIFQWNATESAFEFELLEKPGAGRKTADHFRGVVSDTSKEMVIIYTASANKDLDGIAISGEISTHISANNTSIGNTTIIDSMHINAKQYFSVLHIHSSFPPDDNIAEIWIAPNVGVIKFIGKDGSSNILKSYKIENQ